MSDAEPKKRRGWPKGRKRGRLPDAPIDILAEVVCYGRQVLKMTDVEMGRELGYSRERIRQARERRMPGSFRCAAGHLLPPGRFVYCERCDPLPKPPAAILCLYPGCKNMSFGGVCATCKARQRYRSDPAFKEAHNAAVAAWADRNRETKRRIDRASDHRYRERQSLGGKFPDPMEGL